MSAGGSEPAGYQSWADRQDADPACDHLGRLVGNSAGCRDADRNRKGARLHRGPKFSRRPESPQLDVELLSAPVRVIDPAHGGV